TKRHGGNKGCRSCLVPKEQLTDFSFDIKLNARYHHITDEKIEELNILVQESASQKTISKYCTKHGLRKHPSILDQLTWNRHLQVPQDAYHAVAGKIQRLMECTFSILKPDGEVAFINYWKNLETPAGWYKLPNPIKHRNSFMFSDCLQLAMIMPFLLQCSLKVLHIKDLELASLQKRLVDSTKSRPKMPSPIQIVNAIISCWVTIAKTSHLCFSLTFTEQAYKELEKLLRILLKLFSDNFENLPNLHINKHHVQNARNFGTLVNTAVAVKEMMHKIFKGSVPKMNRKNIELDLIRRHNTLQTIRYLTDGGVDNRFPCIKQGFQKLTTDPLLHSILSDWYMTQIIQKEDITDIVSNTNVVSCDSRVTNIKLYKKLSKIEIQQYNLPVRLDENSQFAHDILIAYDIYMQKKAALIYRHVEFYNQIKYTLLDDDGRFNSHLNLHVGDIVQIQEEENLSYAKIRALFTHKYNNGLVYAFIWINWLRKTSTTDPIIQCPIYEVQTAENTRWYRVYPISFIDNLPKVHFVHCCHSTCTANSHDLSNNHYFKNEFYYVAI
ncbi:hypothetical protein RhiirA4_473628, partial [Rhizophagus irregularis]